MISVFNKWQYFYDNGMDLDVVYIDIAKAFDTVSHIKLISVLKVYGFNANVYSWLDLGVFKQQNPSYVHQ